MSSHYHSKRDAGMKTHDYAITLAEVAREFGVTRERIRQIEDRALRKVRTILHKHGYTLQDFLDGERNG